MVDRELIKHKILSRLADAYKPLSSDDLEEITDDLNLLVDVLRELKDRGLITGDFHPSALTGGFLVDIVDEIRITPKGREELTK